MENKKIYLIGGIILFILSLVGGWLSREYKTKLETKESRIVELEKREILLTAEKTILESQLRRATKKTSKPALDGKGEVIRNADGNTVLETSYEDIFEAYSQQINSMDAQLRTVEKERDDALSLVKLSESSKQGLHRFGLGAASNFAGKNYGMIGVKHPLGAFDIQGEVFKTFDLQPDFMVSFSIWL